jgi:hypothetical protein
MRPLVARLTARGMHREWRAAMPKDLAQVDYVREFIDRLEKNAPTVKRPTLVRGILPPFRKALAERLGEPASSWRRRIAGAIPASKPSLNCSRNSPHRRMPGMNWGVVTATTESDGAERKYERR